MNTLAYDGPGPWILFVPLIWAAVVVAVVSVLRRTGLRGRHGPWGADRPRPGFGENGPVTVLGRRFAAGEIDEEEYWRRLSVLEEHFGRAPLDGKPGPR